MKKSWTSHEQVVTKLWTSREQAVNKLWTIQEQVLNKLWTSHEQVKLWKKFEHVVNNYSHEQVLNNL